MSSRLKRQGQKYRGELGAWAEANPRGTVALRLLYRALVTCLLIPAVAALVAYFIETNIYIPSRRTYSHLLYITAAAWCAAPLILIRWYWPWKQHRMKLEFCIFVLQTAAFFIAIDRTSLSGTDLYQSNLFVREEFRSKQFMSINSKNDTWDWVEGVMKYTYYGREDGFTAFTRKLSGRLSMMTAIRLRQNRVAPQNCSPMYTSTWTAGTGECYPPFSETTESRETFGDYLQFKYYNNPVNSTTGYPISMEDYKVDGAFGQYPLAGSWIWFPPPMSYDQMKSMMQLLRESNWIDDQTRAVGLDLTIALVDFIDKPLFDHVDFFVEVNTAGRFVPMEPTINMNNFHQYEHATDPTNKYWAYFLKLLTGVNLNSLEECQPVGVLGSVLFPMFLGFLPFVVYIFAAAAIDLIHDWRQYIHRPFNLSDLVWCGVVLAAIGYQLLSLRYLDCGSSVFIQTVLDSITGTDFNTTSQVRFAVRLEVLPMARVWTRVRRLIGLAIFVHFFNFLKFLVRLKALGVLVRTLRFAAVELLSFSFSFLVMFVGFVLMFYHIFSIESADFQTVSLTVGTLWLGMLGELELTPELWRGGNITLALFIIFTFMSVFVLLTTIVSIISRAHEDAQKAGLKKAQKPEAEHISTSSLGQFTDVLTPESKDPEADAELEADQAQLIVEGEAMLRTLRRWHSSVMGQRRARKIGIMGDTPKESWEAESEASAGAGQFPDDLSPSTASSTANLFVVPAQVRQRRGSAGKLQVLSGSGDGAWARSSSSSSSTGDSSVRQAPDGRMATPEQSEADSAV